MLKFYYDYITIIVILLLKYFSSRGKNIGVPLVLETNRLLNNLYRLASEDKSISLTILTGLTLAASDS